MMMMNNQNKSENSVFMVKVELRFVFRQVIWYKDLPTVIGFLEVLWMTVDLTSLTNLHWSQLIHHA